MIISQKQMIRKLGPLLLKAPTYKKMGTAFLKRADPEQEVIVFGHSVSAETKSAGIDASLMAGVELCDCCCNFLDDEMQEFILDLLLLVSAAVEGLKG